MTAAAAAGLLEDALGYAIGNIAFATPDLLGRPTPCHDWDLRMLLWHTCASLAALAEGLTTGCMRLTAADDGPPVAGPAEDCTARAFSLLATRPWRGRAEVLVGGRALATGVAVATGALEIAVHGWDVAQACGKRRPIPAALADGLLEIAPLLVTGADRASVDAPPVAATLFAAPLFAAPVPVAAGASASDRLTAFLGRLAAASPGRPGSPPGWRPG
jgi:uncharacterized protein (TIGR03086 family)